MVKIYKSLARKMWENGEEIMIVPDRVKPTSLLATWVSKPEGELEADAFDKLCNAIHYYSCTPQNGMKLVYYAKEI